MNEPMKFDAKAPLSTLVGTYPLVYLRSLPTLAVGQADDLKIEYADARIWLSRCTTEDGEPFDGKVTIERFRGGRWVEWRTYPART